MTFEQKSQNVLQYFQRKAEDVVGQKEVATQEEPCVSTSCYNEFVTIIGFAERDTEEEWQETLDHRANMLGGAPFRTHEQRGDTHPKENAAGIAEYDRIVSELNGLYKKGALTQEKMLSYVPAIYRLFNIKKAA